MALTTHRVHETAEAILACVCAALDEAAADTDADGWCLPGCPTRACVVPGRPAWDSCGADCQGAVPGQLTVHVVGVTPEARSTGGRTSADRMLAAQAASGCAPPPRTVVELVVTLLRCAPTQDDYGCPPPCEEMDAAARVLHADMVTVWQALTCCLPEISRTRRRPMWELPAGPRVLGPEGGCVGLEQRVLVTLPPVCCPQHDDGAAP